MLTVDLLLLGLLSYVWGASYGTPGLLCELIWIRWLHGALIPLTNGLCINVCIVETKVRSGGSVFTSLRRRVAVPLRLTVNQPPSALKGAGERQKSKLKRIKKPLHGRGLVVGYGGVRGAVTGVSRLQVGMFGGVVLKRRRHLRGDETDSPDRNHSRGNENRSSE